MSKHLKLFNSQADYDNFLENVTFSTPVPNVSYVEATDDVHYNKTLRIRVPNNVIMYKAPAKLPETTDDKEDGFRVDAFNTTVKSHTFADGIGVIEFNADVTTMGDYSFRGCGFTDIVLPDSVTSLGTQALSYCINLTSVIIPSRVTNLGHSAFSNSKNLASITSLATTAPTLGSKYVFDNVKTAGTLCVPTGSTGYDVWMGADYLGKYNWTKVEQ